MLPELTLPSLKASATGFARGLNEAPIPDLYGTTDGKAVGTYIEQKFRRYLEDRFSFTPGNSASGIDFPELQVDMKATSITQPQSSCPFRDANQKVYGLGYHLLVFVYGKADDHALRSARLDIRHIVFVERVRTADWQTTTGIVGILDRQKVTRTTWWRFLRNATCHWMKSAAMRWPSEFCVTGRPSGI